MGRILVELDLLSPLRGILWVPYRQEDSGTTTYLYQRGVNNASKELYMCIVPK